MSDVDDYKTEMDITYREIEEVNDRLRDLTEEERILWGHVKGLDRAWDEALKSGIPEDIENIGATRKSYGRQHSEAQAKITELKARKSALWDAHNEAKDQWRRGRGR
jgi:chromosome segregation ATPase